MIGSVKTDREETPMLDWVDVFKIMVLMFWAAVMWALGRVL